MTFDVVVIGGGHAGCEAAHAAARCGARVALVTLRADAVGRLSCNPAIGGIGKGHLVAEIDALDGLMSRVADRAAIQFRLLNRSRGPAVRGPRAQVDRDIYPREMQAALSETPGLTVVEGEAADLLVADEAVAGVRLADGRTLRSGAVVLTTGTFLGGMVHIGDEHWPAGRMGEGAANAIAARLSALALPLGRLKTGTPPRLRAESVDWDTLEHQPGDPDPLTFHDLSDGPVLPQRVCAITRTTEATHAIVRAALSRSAMFSGHITGVGPRYCPSIEDKVVRFADRPSHQIFLEPEGLSSPLLYPNGISNSLPRAVQLAMVRSLPGCERAEIDAPGYAIEYTFVDPRALDPTLEVSRLPGLFLAGQINGTTGYEEAGAQGLLAGLNAARRAAGTAGIVVERERAYLGVLVDDLVTQGVEEPYRMFTSRAEHRLTLRVDNAGDRLSAWGAALGIVGSERAERQRRREERLVETLAALRAFAVTPSEAKRLGLSLKEDGRRRDGLDLLAHPGGGMALIGALVPEAADLPPRIEATVEAEALYRAAISRQKADHLAADTLPIPAALHGAPLPGLTNELRQKLAKRRPATIAEARAISGMTPAALALLVAHARQAQRAA